MSNARADPCVPVIFGASGDLTRRKLLPSAYNLAELDLLPEPFAVLGVARPAIDDAGFRAEMRRHVAREEGETLDDELWKRIEDRLHYLSGNFDDPALYQRVALGGIHTPALVLLRTPPSARTTHVRPPDASHSAPSDLLFPHRGILRRST